VLVPWRAEDLTVLEHANSAELTRYLGGIETPDDLTARHAQYLAFARTGEGAMFRIEVDAQPAGYAGWWTELHDDVAVSEVGCVVLTPWQGRGVAADALTQVVELSIGATGRAVVGYADVRNAASAALCRRVGFELRGHGVFPSDAGDTEVGIWVIDPPSVG
jgi:RimJ/RimL family protein N-acetyltransferase